MNSIVRIVGYCLVAGTVTAYFSEWVVGIYAALFVAGVGLIRDSMK